MHINIHTNIHTHKDTHVPYTCKHEYINTCIPHVYIKVKKIF